jgi:hypothetical protein
MAAGGARRDKVDFARYIGWPRDQWTGPSDLVFVFLPGREGVTRVRSVIRPHP